MNLAVVNMNLESHGRSAATFKTGIEVNIAMKKLAGAPESEDKDYRYIDRNILSIEKATNEQYNNIKDNLTEDNIVSTSDSSKIIYMWYDSGTIYWYSEASLIYLNEDSSIMFDNCYGLTSLDLSSFNTSNVTNMSDMFEGCINLTSLDISSFDTSKVTDMQYMFECCFSLTSLDLSSFDTSNVTNMQGMFNGTDNMLTITTPKKMFDSDLEIVVFGYFVDEAGNRYSALNKDTPTKITIHR